MTVNTKLTEVHPREIIKPEEGKKGDGQMVKHKNEQGTDAAANPHHQGWNKLTRDCIEKTTASTDSTDPTVV